MRDAVGRVESVLVIGGTSEIGMATARTLVDRGARRVVLAGRDEAALSRAAHALAREGVSVATARFDAEDDPLTHERFVEEVFSHGDFDVVVMAFGVLGDQRTDEEDAASALRVLTANFLGAVSVGIPVVRKLRGQGHGTLVVLSSVAAERARRANYVYGSSKAGLDAFFRGAGEALRGSGARVLIVRPGFVRTRMTSGRAAAPLASSPGEVGRAIAGALERRDEILWVPPALRWVMTAVRHLPRALFRQIRT